MIAPTARILWVAAVIVLPLATAAGIAPGAAPWCAAAVAICAAVCIADAWKGSGTVRAIQVRAPEYLRLTKDVAASLPVTVENGTGAALRLRLGIAMPEGMEAEKDVLTVDAPQGHSVVAWGCIGRERGDHPLSDVWVEAESPLGLWQARAPRAVNCTFRVYPNLRDRATAGLFLKTANLGIRMYRQVGKGREFENLRQYFAGDSFEDIHWKATAKRGHPAVKVYRVEHAQEVYAIIDASRLSAREGILDGYVDAALHLALVAERQGDRFGVVTFSDRTQRFVRARNGMDHFRMCRETIYNVRAERVSPDFREVFTSLQLNLRRRALLVFFTSLDDALLAETFERDISILSRRHVVLVNVTRTAALQPLFTAEAPESLDAVYERLAGQMLSNRMRTLKVALQNRGVKLAVVDPEKIKMQVTAQFLDVKRRQVL